MFKSEPLWLMHDKIIQKSPSERRKIHRKKQYINNIIKSNLLRNTIIDVNEILSEEWQVN